LTDLKRSMSNSISAIVRPVWRVRAIARSSRARNRVRLGRPVRLSYWASCCSRSSARRRSPRSRIRTRYCCRRSPDTLAMARSTGTSDASGRRSCASPSRSLAGAAAPAGGAMRNCSRCPASAEGASPSSCAAAALQLAISPCDPHRTSPSEERSKTSPRRRCRWSRPARMRSNSARTSSNSARGTADRRSASQRCTLCPAARAAVTGRAAGMSGGSAMTVLGRLSARAGTA